MGRVRSRTTADVRRARLAVASANGCSSQALGLIVPPTLLARAHTYEGRGVASRLS